MKRKLIIIGSAVLVLALLLTLAPACGNGDGDEDALQNLDGSHGFSPPEM